MASAGCFPFPRRRSQRDPPRISEISIYYGTMFGNAERHARSLAHEIMTQRRLRVEVQDLDAFNETAFTDAKHLTRTRLHVFVVSTHFAGSPSPSAERFHKWIKALDHDATTGARSSVDQSPVSATSRPTPSTGKSSWMSRYSSPRRACPISILRPPDQPLRGLQYTVFGIGDSAYLTYNAMGKFVDLKLKRLGATRFLSLGLGDCSNGLQATFEAWEASLLEGLPRRRSTSVMQGVNFVSSLSTVTNSRLLSMKAKAVVPHDEPQHQSVHAKLSQARPAKGSASSLATHAERIAAQEGRSPGRHTASPLTIRDNFSRNVRLRFRCHVLDLEEECELSSRVAPPAADTTTGTRTPRVALFDENPFAEVVAVESVGGPGPNSISKSGERTYGIFRVRLVDPNTTYTAVSTLAIYPYNNPHLVNEIADAFCFDLDAIIDLTVGTSHAGTDASQNHALRQQLPFPTPCTVRTALTEFLELRTVSREFIRIASGFVVTSEELELLESLATTDGSNAFRSQISDQHKGILDLVALAPTLMIPLEVFMNITPIMKPRYYTIASSPLVSPHELDIAVALGDPRQPRGLGASFFAHLLATNPTAPLPLRGFISASRFQFQDDGVAPMVFIATGVGFTAMRAIILERLAKWFQNPPTTAAIPKQLLFLGAANEDSLVFSKDLRHWEQHMLVKVHVGFSNDRRHTRQYVQDVVASRMDEVFETVTSSNGSRIFVCGRTAMLRRVRELFEADQMRRRSRWFDTLHASGRFIEEGFE